MRNDNPTGLRPLADILPGVLTAMAERADRPAPVLPTPAPSPALRQWEARMEKLRHIRPRTEEERIAVYESTKLMEMARPWP